MKGYELEHGIYLNDLQIIVLPFFDLGWYKLIGARSTHTSCLLQDENEKHANLLDKYGAYV